MRWTVRNTWLAASAAALAGCSGADAISEGPTRDARLVKVIDGDTVRVQSEGRELTVRLIGVDAPESNHPDRPVECGSGAATKRLQRLVERHGADVRLVYDPSQDRQDRFDRELAYVESDGQDLGERLIRAGLARSYVYAARFARVGRYESAERQARDDDAGLWKRCDGDFHRPRE